MWIARNHRKDKFIQAVKSLKNQVLLVRGARQVDKTSFILDALKGIDNPRININLASRKKETFQGEIFYGRDYFGSSEEADQLLTNLSYAFGSLDKIKMPVVVFIDEADRHAVSLEAIQKLAALSQKIKFIFTGSNLENVILKNAATGRKQYFDLYPVTFSEFLAAYEKRSEFDYLNSFSLKCPHFSEYNGRGKLDHF